MGDTFGGGNDDERPVHRLCLDSFKMDACEVTNAQFERFKPGFGESRSEYNGEVKVSGGDNQPVVNVTWYEANEYCRSVGKRLPTEAEWEYAARSGGKREKYATSTGELTQELANYDSNKTKDVGSYPPNALGLYDMAGNVWEWTADWYKEDYYKTSTEKNPKGPANGAIRVLRGGSWHGAAEYLRASDRSSIGPAYRYNNIGFRCSQ